jgi:transcription elongation factor Elf1
MVIFFLTTCALGYACYNLIKKIEVYEDWLDMFRNEIDQVYSKIKAVDDRNLFEKDDDVGFVFSEIVRITKEFDEKIK